MSFQHTAARRRLDLRQPTRAHGYGFQHTAARRRLGLPILCGRRNKESFNTQPPEGGWGWFCRRRNRCEVSTHSRPKAAGVICSSPRLWTVFQHTAARRRLAESDDKNPLFCLFQHTAARRRLARIERGQQSLTTVSTHSRPKAAGRRISSCHNA